MEPDKNKTATPLRAIAWSFLKLGTIGFGGPAAHIALMQHEFVVKRQWLTDQEFIDLLGATNLIPGPNSTEMAIHIGHRRAGGPGLIVAGTCFIVPAMLIVLGCAWAYVRYGKLPQVEGLLYGVKPVMIAIIFQALWKLAGSALKSWGLRLVAAAVVALAVLHVNELALLFGAGAAAAFVRLAQRPGKKLAAFALPPGLAVPLISTMIPVVPATPAAAFGLWPLFLFFLKVGSVLYGSGYVLLAFLRGGLVQRLHWLSETQLLDAVAVGQITPGPLFTTATFVGYVLGGPWAGLVATGGIFLPAFLFVALSGPLVPRLRRSATAGAVLDGVNAASLGLMAAVTIQLGGAALVDWLTLLLAITAGTLLFLFKPNSAWLVLGGAAAGLARSLL